MKSVKLGSLRNDDNHHILAHMSFRYSFVLEQIVREGLIDKSENCHCVSRCSTLSPQSWALHVVDLRKLCLFVIFFIVWVGVVLINAMVYSDIKRLLLEPPNRCSASPNSYFPPSALKAQWMTLHSTCNFLPRL